MSSCRAYCYVAGAAAASAAQPGVDHAHIMSDVVDAVLHKLERADQGVDKVDCRFDEIRNPVLSASYEGVILLLSASTVTVEETLAVMVDRICTRPSKQLVNAVGFMVQLMPIAVRGFMTQHLLDVLDITVPASTARGVSITVEESETIPHVAETPTQPLDMPTPLDVPTPMLDAPTPQVESHTPLPSLFSPAAPSPGVGCATTPRGTATLVDAPPEFTYDPTADIDGALDMHGQGRARVLCALTHAIWFHDRWQIDHLLPRVLDALTPVVPHVRTLEQLAFIIHIFGPYMPKLVNSAGKETRAFLAALVRVPSDVFGTVLVYVMAGEGGFCCLLCACAFGVYTKRMSHPKYVLLL